MKSVSKKELQVAEFPLFQSSKMLNFYFGTPTSSDFRTLYENFQQIAELDYF